MAESRARSGVLVVDKPKGPTSHDVVARLRRVLGTRQVGHAGTLDPMATGVLVVAIDEATKLVPWLTADDKTYEATVTLGIGTDSFDAEGQETGRSPIGPELEAELRDVSAGHIEVTSGHISRIAAALDAERARTQQVPPAFSAIRVGGVRSHALARRGETPDLPPREVVVRRLAITGGGLEPAPHLDLVLEVTKGYYVRSLARDLAITLGTLGHLTALRRIRSGSFTTADAAPLDADRETLLTALLPLEVAAARALPTSRLTDVGVLAAIRGQRVAPADLADPHAGPSAWLDGEGHIVAIGEVDPEGAGRVLRGFVRPGTN